MKFSKWLPPGVVLIVLGTLTQDTSSTMIMGSMLLGSMAANTAMLLGKMSLGGLMMMMLSQQNGGGGGGETAGLLSSLGNLGRQLGNTLNTLSGAASSMNNKRTTRSHAPISLAPPMVSAAANSGTATGTVVKKVRYSRPHQANPAHGHSGHGHGHSQAHTHNHNQNSHGHTHSSHSQGHSHGQHGHALQDQVQSWPAAPAQKPVQIQGYGTPSLQDLQDQQILDQLHQEIQKQQQLHQQYRKRVARSVVEQPALAPAQAVDNGQGASSTTSTTSSTTTAAPPSSAPGSDSAQSESAENPPAEDDENVTQKLLTYTRLMRQADSFDYMSCLPKFVCGLEAQPPTKKTSILNDYSHLLKLLFGPDDDDDDELDDELPSDEDLNVNHAEAYRLALSNKDRLDEKVNDELLDEDPGMLGYVLKDIARKGLKKNKNSFGYQPPMGHYYPSMNLPLEQDEPPQSSSILSSFLPKISAGFGTSSKSDDPAFDNDPFFSGFKRSLDVPVVGVGSVTAQAQSANNEINVNDFEDGGKNVKRSKRISDNSRKRRKREAIEEIIQNDPVITKYRRAQEIGRQSNRKGAGQRDCSNAFKHCPYSWDQIMGMISNMRNVIAPGNGTRPPPAGQDKVVVLQVPTSGGGLGKTSATKTYTKNGATKVTHDMGNGNVMQITVKLAPKVTGFEPVPVVESEPYQENDELDIEAVKLLPKPAKPTPRTTTTPKPRRTPKPKPIDAAIGELDPVDPETEEESDEEISREQEKAVAQVAQKLHSQNIGNGTRKAKPKRKFKPSPNTNFDFASDVDIMGVKGGTILPKQGADKEVQLKRQPPVYSMRTTSATTQRPKPKSTTVEPDPRPIGSANGKNGNRPGLVPPYKIKKRDPSQVVVLPLRHDTVKPAASYKDNSDEATTSEENDDESDEGFGDYPEAAEDEFILDDRENDFRSNSNKKRRRPLPSRFRFDDPAQQQQEPVQMSNHSPTPNAASGGGLKARRPPFPMLMRKSPIMYDNSKSWLPIGDARAFSDGQQPQQQQQ